MGTGTEIVRANSLPMQGMAELEKLGAIIAQSGMFGASNAAEGLVIAAMCHQDGISYSKWMQTNHLIKGKQSKRADAMLADFCRMGGTYRIVNRTGDEASVEFTYGKAVYLSALTWAEAQNEPFVYIGKEDEVLALLETPEGKAKLRVKPKYASPRSRMQMLWARVVSDGVRTVCPEAVQGVYTPEEVEDFTAAPAAQVERDITPPPPAGQPAASEPAKKTRAKSSPAATAVLDAEVVVSAPSAPATPPPAQVPADQSEPVLETTPPSPTDYSRCPMIPGFSMSGTAWADITTDRLKKALTATRPEITAMHRAAIEQVIASRA